MLLLLLTVCLYSKHIAFQQLLADNSGGRRIRRHGPNSVLVARLLAGPVPHSSGHAARGRADQSVSVCVRVRVRCEAYTDIRSRISQNFVPNCERS